MGRIYDVGATSHSNPLDYMRLTCMDQGFLYQTKRKQHCVAWSDIGDISSMFDGGNDTTLDMISQSDNAAYRSSGEAPH